MKIINNGVQEGHVLIKQFFRVFMDLYFVNSLSQNVKIYMILCVYYTPTKKVITSPLAQQIFMVVGRYQNIQVKILFFSLCVTINFIDTWINTFEKIISWSCFVYQYKMK